MKKLLLTGILLLLGTFVIAQSKYETTMQQTLVGLKLDKTPLEFVATSQMFTRIGMAEKTQWLPFYYAALSQIEAGRSLMMKGETADLDQYADPAITSIKQAQALNGDPVELNLLIKMAYQLKMLVNPSARYMTDGQTSDTAFQKAKEAAPNNPRVVLLEAEDLYFMPTQFGGDKKQAMVLFAKAKELFKTFKPKSDLEPNWGESDADYFLSQSQK